MAGTMLSGNAMYSVALECALRRAGRSCKETFGSQICLECRHYIGNYVDADPRQLNLYMYQADVNASAMRTSAFYSKLRSLIILLFLAFIGYIFYIGFTAPARIRARNNVVTVQTVTPQQARTDNRSTHQMIEDALWAVSRDMNAGRDMNRDGKINCEDAAILFYMHYPIKREVRIYANDNPATGMSHAFNLVLIDGVWRAIEPQAYHVGWHKMNTYFMRDIWGAKYDHTKNKNAWDDYGRWVR